MRAENRKARSLWQRMRSPSVARVEVVLFLLVWLAYGVAINSDNLVKFNLQQIGVEAIVERHQFYLEGSDVPELQPLGDVFLYQGHKYAAKQPGQFMAGAAVYWVLRGLGLRYKDNYLLTSALVTFFTTSLVLALTAVAVFRIARKRTKDARSLFWPMVTTLVYAFGTTVFAYSGIAHHDALATGYLAIAFYLIFDLPRGGWDGRGAMIQSASAGLLLGLAVTTSMLVFFMTIVCALYFLWLRRWKLVPFFLGAILMGLLPLLVYDARSFGNPFLLPNVAGNYADTYFHFSPNNLGDKLVFYVKALISYAPIFVIGCLGLSYFPRALKRERYFLALVAMMLVLAIYVFNIDTVGAYQFGPRYLLPAMPFACFGLVGYSYLSKAAERRLAAIIIVFVGMISFSINLVGALQGAMCCPEGKNVFLNHLAAISRGELRSCPLAPWLLVPLALCTVLFLLTILATQRRGRISLEFKL
jgi:hypothetical protein